MKKNLLFLSLVYVTIPLAAQNVGIGTSDPQNKLHVAGGVRIDALSGTTGIVTKDATGDLSAVAYTGNSEDVLKGNGSFGAVAGLLPSSGVVLSKTHNNTALINAGFSLMGEIPEILTYSTYTTTFDQYSWLPTYTRGIQGHVSAPTFGNYGSLPLALWTGSTMYVVNSEGAFSYDPDLDQWTLLSSSFKAGNVGDGIVWTGTEIILWRGQDATGSRFNPSTNVITNLPTINAPSSRYEQTTTWDGSRMIVWGGESGGAAVNNGGMYNPSTNSWTVVSNAGAPAPRQKHTAIWCPGLNRLIIWGGSSTAFSGEMNTGAVFNPATNSWTGATQTTGAPNPRFNHTVVWSGNEMIVFGGMSIGASTNTGGRYNAVTNTWTAMSQTGAPTVRMHAAVWSGTEMYVSGGIAGTVTNKSVLKYEPALNLWTNLTQFPENKYGHHSFYKSNMLIVWGGISATSDRSNTGFRWILEPTNTSVTKFQSETRYLYQKD